jgi:hypothetical protein
MGRGGTALVDLIRELDALGRIYYRRRLTTKAQERQRPRFSQHLGPPLPLLHGVRRRQRHARRNARGLVKLMEAIRPSA